MKTAPSTQSVANSNGKRYAPATKVRRLASMIAFGSFLAACTGLNAQTTWKGGGTGGDGEWIGNTTWTNNEPTSSVEARFQKDATYTSGSATISVSGAAQAKNLRIARGESVTLNLADTASLSGTSAINLIGAALGTGTGAASLTIAGPASGSATAAMGVFYVGGETIGVNGNSLTFTGNITVSDPGAVSSLVGRFGNNNTLNILNGANVTRYSLDVGYANSGAPQAGEAQGNGVVVSGTNSALTISNIFTVGGKSATYTPVDDSDRYNKAAQGNFIKVLAGGTTTIVANATNGIGGGIAAHSNFVEVSDANSTLVLGGALRIGDSGLTNLGGNYLKVSSGGTVKANSTINIYQYAANSGYNDGANKLIIGPGGTFTAISTITNNGVVQLAATGTLNGTGILNVTSGARFEAAGSGLGTTIATNINSGGTLAVGLSGAISSSALTLSSGANKMNLQAGSILEMGIFGASSNDQLNIATGGVLTVASGINFKLTLEGYTPVGGETWTIFTGLTAAGLASTNATNMAGATFVLPSLAPGLSWNTSNFNTAGNWQIAVAVPEPSACAMLVFAIGGLGLLSRNGKARRAGTSKNA